jgi:cytochrome c oxidase subunit II
MRGALLLAFMLLLAGCASDRQSMLLPMGEQAREIDIVWRVMLVVCGIMYALVLVFLLWSLLRARRAAKVATLAAPKLGHSPNERALERGLGAWIGLIVVGLTGLTATSFAIDAALARNEPGALQIRMTANQWWWSVEYEGSTPDQTIRTANELYLPVDRPVEIELRANDVIHSLWIPNLAGKRDLIPGRVNSLTITPRREGVYRAQCAEFCGLQHALMALEVNVVTDEAFEAWRERALEPARAPLTPSQSLGQRVFLESACVMCHTVSGTDANGVTGPDLTHIGSRPSLAAGTLANTPANMALWIENPQRFKAGVNMPAVSLSDEEMAALTDYLDHLE